LHSKLEVVCLLCILAVFAILASQYSTAAPILESYDERYHFAYILSIALDHGLPVQDVAEPGPWGNEGSQPPLYYVLAAAISSWTAHAGFSQQIEPNPYATRHLAVEPDDNRNYFIHRRVEDFPYSGNVLAFHLARWLSALFGGLAVLATYLSGKLIWPGRPWVALSACAFQAFIPSFIFIASSASNDAAVIALASLSLWQTLRAARADDLSAARCLLLGLLLGLATLAKLGALPLVAASTVAVCWSPLSRAQWRRAIRNGLLLGASFGAVTGWWFIRNWVLYREWLGTDTMNRIAGLRSQQPSLAELWDALRGDIEPTFWAAFGSGNVHPPDILLFLPRLLALLGLAGCTLAFAQQWRRARISDGTSQRRRTVVILTVWVALFLASFAWWLLHVERVTGRLLFPLLTPLSLGIGYGLVSWTPKPLQATLAGVVAIGMLTVAAAMLPVALVPAYARPPAVSGSALAQVANQADVIFGDKIRLRAYALQERNMEAGRPVHVDLYWQALTRLDGNYTVYVHLLDRHGQMIGGSDSLPGRGAFPTTEWTPGLIYRDRVTVYANNVPSEPIVVSLITGWYDTATHKALAARSSDGKPLSLITVGGVRVSAGEIQAQVPARVLSANFADLIEVLGYDVGPLALTLYWRARAPIAEDYTVFVHVLDDRSALLAQADSQPRGGDYPTSYWLPGEIVRDSHPLRLPANAAAISIGLYQLDTGARLSLAGQSGDALTIVAGTK
jgi:hypothetical protein